MHPYARLAALCLFLIPACARQTGPTQIDEPVGRYQVQASLIENACGEGHPAPPMLSFVVDLSHLPGSTRGDWKLPDGPQIDGTLERSADFRFEQVSQIIVVPRDMAMNVPGCTIERREVVRGTLEAVAVETPDGGVVDAGQPDAGSAVEGEAGVADASAPDAGTEDRESAISGATTVTISAVPGGNCAALLAVYGGPFPTIPCAIDYDLSGVRVTPP